MRVQATNAMTKEINKFLKANGVQYSASYETMSERQYALNVDIDIYNNEADYLPQSGKMRTIKIAYPCNYYACPRYLTTAELIKIFKRSNKTLNGFMSVLLDEIAI